LSKSDQRSPPAPESRWLLLLRLRWPLGGAIALAFAVGQIAETLLLDERRPALRLLLDVVAWGLLGGLAVWISLTWASRVERRYQASLERALSEQRELNRRVLPTRLPLAAALGAEAPPPERLGPYRVGELLGRGGMGRVFRAERADGVFEQEVAIKLMRRSFASEALAQQFARQYPHRCRRLVLAATSPGAIMIPV